MGRNIAATVLMLATALAMLAMQSPATAIALSAQPTRGSTAALEKVEAETAKLQQEAAKLAHDNELLARLLPILTPLLTAIAAAGGVLASVWKVGKDRRDAIDREARQRDDTREAAEIERFDDRFAKAVEGLSSAKPGEEIGAAVLIASMVRDKREALSSQTLQLLLVSLQTPHDEVCERLLRFALERFARAAPQRLVPADDGAPTVGLAHTRASYLNLAHLKLPGLDIAFASLPKADFRGADLRGSRAFKAQLDDAVLNRTDLTKAEWVDAEAPRARFRKARLTNARLFRTDLSGANFYRADLRGANLRQARLEGAEFKRAQLEKADFHGAHLDDGALESILEADAWELAQLSSETRSRLEELADEKRERRAL